MRRILFETHTLFAGLLVKLHSDLLTAENDAFKQINVVFSFGIVFDDSEGVLEHKSTERIELMSFPIFHSFLQFIDCQLILSVSSGFIDSISHSCDRRQTFFQLFEERSFRMRMFDELLKSSRFPN